MENDKIPPRNIGQGGKRELRFRTIRSFSVKRLTSKQKTQIDAEALKTLYPTNRLVMDRFQVILKSVRTRGLSEAEYRPFTNCNNRQLKFVAPQRKGIELQSNPTMHSRGQVPTLTLSKLCQQMKSEIRMLSDRHVQQIASRMCANQISTPHFKPYLGPP